MKEREINLIDLIIEILLRWRVIVVAMVVGGVLFGAFSFMQSIRDARAQADRIEKLKEQLKEDGTDLKDVIKDSLDNEEVNLGDTIQEWVGDEGIDLEDALKNELTDKQLNNVNYAIYYENLYHAQEEYQKQSVLMQIEPKNTQVAEITFKVSSDDLEKTYNLERVYEDVISSAELLAELADASKVSVPAVRDICVLTRGSSGLLKGSDTFKVTIYHYDENLCQTLAQTVIDYISMKHDEMEEKLGIHEVTILNQSMGTLFSERVLSIQRNYESDLLGLWSTAINYKTIFTDEEWYYYNYLTTKKVAGNPDAQKLTAQEETANKEDNVDEKSILDTINAGVTITPHVSLKYVALGMILFAFVYAFLIFMWYVWDNKLRTTDHLQTLYGIPQLGQIPSNQESKRLFHFVDEWILSLRYWKQRRFMPEEALKLAAVAVKMAAGKNAVTAVCLIGCDLKEQTIKICEQIKTLIGEEVEIQILNNVLYDAETMGKLDSAEGVVLVEKAASTLHTEIVQELELLKRQQIKILGGIVVE